jgi:hypothetical protein
MVTMKTNKELFIQVDKEYGQYQKHFDDFVKSIKHLEDSLESLKFMEQSDRQRIEFNFLGYSYSIRHCCTINSGGKIESKLLCMSKITVDDDDKYAPTALLFSIDKDGNVHLPGDDGNSGRPISQQEWCEKIFFVLLGGKPDFTTNYTTVYNSNISLISES